MRTLLTLLTLMPLTPVLADLETWTSKDGRKTQLELLSVQEINGKHTGTFKNPAGQEFKISEDRLSEADAQKLKEWEPTATTGPSPYDDLLANHLVKLQGKRVKSYTPETKPKHLAFYFSAHWCPPCRKFTPKLVEFYNQHPNARDTFEIIFVSSDRGKREMEDYIEEAEMPWPAIEFRHVDRADEVQKLAGRGIPCLVIVDPQGNIIQHSYDGENYLGPTVALRRLEEIIKAQQ